MLLRMTIEASVNRVRLPPRFNEAGAMLLRMTVVSRRCFDANP